MEKPTFKKVCLMHLQQLTNFPYIEKDFDAVTDYELLCLVVDHLNEVIKNSNEQNTAIQNLYNAFVALKDYVDNYFENLDVQEEIDSKLDEMAKDGTLAKIINTEIFNDLNEKINNAIIKSDPQTMNELFLNRILRTFERNSNNPEHVSGEDYAVLQGGCYTGNNKIIIARLRRNDLNEVLLQEISLYDSSVIRQITLQLNHANSIAYNPNNRKLYITSLVMNENDENIPLQYLYVIDYTTFTLESTISLDVPLTEGVHSVSYDIETNKYYIATEETNNNNSLKLYEMNINNYSLTEINLSDYSNLLNKTYNNDILVYNDYLYVLKFNPQVLLCFNLQNNKLYNVYNIPNYSDGSSIGELQNISLKYDSEEKDFIIGTNRLECDNGFYNMFQYFNCNVFYNINNNIMPKYNNNEIVLNVDINSNSINPNGTNSNKFKHISEALEYAQQLDGNITILIANGTYPFVDYKGNKQRIDIRNNSDNPDITINGMNLHATNISLTYIKLLNTSISQNYDLSADYTKLRLSIIEFLGDYSASIYARRCEIDFYHLTSDHVLFHCQTETTLIPHDEVVDFSFNNQKPYCAIPNKICNELNVNNTRIDSPSLPKKEFLLKQKGTIRINYYGKYNRGFIDFNHDGNESVRNFSFNINRYFYEVECYFDYTNNKIGFKLLNAIQLNNDGTVTNNISTESIILTPYFI